MTGAQALVRQLIAEGVDTVFALPGVQVMAIFDALHEHSESIRLILRIAAGWRGMHRKVPKFVGGIESEPERIRLGGIEHNNGPTCLHEAVSAEAGNAAGGSFEKTQDMLVQQHPYGLISRSRITVPRSPKGPRGSPLRVTLTPPAFPRVKKNRS